MSQATLTTLPTATSPLVVYAKKSGHTSTTAGAASYIPHPGQLIWLLALAAILTWINPFMFVIGLVALSLVLASVIRLCQKFRQTPPKPASKWHDVPEYPDSIARVGCVGQENDLAQVDSHGPISDMAFEPVVVSAPGALPLLKRQYAAWIVLGVAAIGALTTAKMVLFASGHWFGIFWMGVAIGGVGMAVIWPTSLRVVPGRVDIVRFTVLGQRIIEVIRHDLRNSAVLVDLNNMCVYLAKDGQTKEIGFGAVPNPHEFAHSVLLAAVSTHEPAPLPDDALVG